MSKTIAVSLAFASLLGLAPLAASAAPAAVPVAPHAIAGAMVQQADWGGYCGPRCQAWHHERWEHRRAERRREEWRREHYGWNGPYRHY